MQNFIKVPFKMPEIFPHTLGGGLKIWASIFITYNHVIIYLLFRAIELKHYFT